MKIEAQDGPQRQFLESPADIAIYGGGAGGGKTFAILLDALRYRSTPGFTAVCFRRSTPEIAGPGGMLEKSVGLYGHPSLRARLTRSPTIMWRFPSGATVRMSHMETPEDRLAWAGSEIAGIYFDELQSFTEEQFWFLLSRNRTTCGVNPFVRATCNPDPDSFVSKLIEWWIDEETGLPIPERSGVLRFFGRDDAGELVWADSPDALKKRLGADCEPKSFTFIPALVHDNKVLLSSNRTYLSTLKALPKVDRERLLNGNWKIRPSAGLFFRREWFRFVDAAPEGGTRIRFWDRAATPGGGDWTAGVLVSKDSKGMFFVEDVVRLQGSPQEVERAIVNTASRDEKGVKIRLEEQPGAAGKMEAGHLIRALAGYDVKAIRPTGDKQTRAKPASSQCEAGNAAIVKGPWNDPFVRELENFPTGKHDDQVDGFSGALNELASMRKIFFAMGGDDEFPGTPGFKPVRSLAEAVSNSSRGGLTW